MNAIASHSIHYPSRTRSRPVADSEYYGNILEEMRDSRAQRVCTRSKLHVKDSRLTNFEAPFPGSMDVLPWILSSFGRGLSARIAMRLPSIAMICILATVSVIPARSALPQAVERHELTVAANSLLLVSDAEVDNIIQQMNKIMSSSSYSWDAACPNVKFARKGAVINISGLALSGTYDDLANELKEKAPSADVMLVSSIDCAGIDAAGCGNVGTEPVIVGLYPGYDAQLW